MKPDFSKGDGLLPVVIQNVITSQVLMVGYMNEEAFGLTKSTGLVTFYSRSKQRLWTKGETSGNNLRVAEVLLDCDSDSILIKANPLGPVCHTGRATCFEGDMAKGFLYQLQATINKRIQDDSASSYTSRLFKKGINKIAQKVGEEAVELIIEAKDENAALFKEEAADLLYHFLLLLAAKSVVLEDIEHVLELRQRN